MIRRLYGGTPLHLLALVASFAIAGAAVVGWFSRSSDLVGVLGWFVAAIVAHDLVLLPLYSLLDRIAFGRHGTGKSVAVPAAPYFRVPALLSGLLLLVYFPTIFKLGQSTFHTASGLRLGGYLTRWLAVTGVLFAASGLAYAYALRRSRRTRPRRARSSRRRRIRAPRWPVGRSRTRA